MAMCGILGVVAEPGNDVGLSTAQLVAMRDRMVMRGPDDAGVFEERNIAFAHRRLAIRDLSAGRQPWCSDDGETVLVYNGELYNDDVLREELQRCGHRFLTGCDTEVVMAAYREWGVDCVQRFRGMFAFGCYDFREDSLFLARDRFGIKPLFLAELNGQLLFASSVSALVEHPKFLKRPCWPAVSHYLTTFRLTMGRMTLYEGVQQLLPGERLLWKSGELRIDRYWDYPDEADERNGEGDVPDYAESVETLQRDLREAVEVRLASDVPVGLFLSGGVDSNTLACLLRELRPDAVLSGHCGGGAIDSPDKEEEADGARSQAAVDPQNDDFTYAERCAELTGFDFQSVRVNASEYYDGWEHLLEQSALPLSTPTDVIIYRLSQEAKKTVGVVLGGEGADELLCGYTVPHYAGHDYDRLQQLENGTWDGGADGGAAFRESVRQQYGRDQFSSLTDHYFALNSLIPSSAKAMLFQPWLWEEIDGDAMMHETYAALLGETDDETGDDQQQFSSAYLEMRLLHRVNLEGQLARLDSATMAAGLEARVPYVDHHLVERMFPLPERYKIDVSRETDSAQLGSVQEGSSQESSSQEGAVCLSSLFLDQQGMLHSKRLLRSVAAGLMPEPLAQRKKASFPTPLEHWLTNDWAETVRDELTSSPFGKKIFRPEVMAELSENLPAVGLWLWPILNLLKWGDSQFQEDDY